jgi:N-methylhydantoinase A/oxoprolinase/acetone carboxylase beta subunit
VTPLAAPLGIGIDTGGTFTDIVLFDLGTGRLLRKAKTPTTHGDYTVCVGKAFDALAASPAEVAALRRVALSTTLATNTVAEDKVHPTALVIEPGDVRLPAEFHPYLAVLKSQVGFNTEEVVPVSEREVREKTEALADSVDSFAVSGYASTRNPAHEQQIAALLRRMYRKPVVLGSELTHRLNFMQRAQAAALNAGLLPVILEWIEAVKLILKRHGIACALYIVKGDGSLMEEQEAVQRPVQTLFSGPAASLQGGVYLSRQSEAVVVDVGGTTTDIGRVHGGRAPLKTGGILINDRQIAVDGLDIATFGLAGDSRLMRLGEMRFRFVNERALPFCRARERYPSLSLDAVKAELTDQWHFGDWDLIELVGLDALRLGKADLEVLSATQRWLVERLREQPRRVRALSEEQEKSESEIASGQAAQSAGVQPVGEAVQDLIRRRLAVRIALTPTDIYCARGHAPGFAVEDARQAAALYARMADQDPEPFLQRMHEVIRGQATGILVGYLAGFDPPLDQEGPVMEKLVTLMHTANEAAGPEVPTSPLLALDPRCAIVLAGAGAPVLYADAPPAIRQRMLAPKDGDVANALGAITTRFLLRESVTIEPTKRGTVELYDHHGKRPFETLGEAMTHARTALKTQLEARAAALKLQDIEYEASEDIVEDYAEFSRRARKELVIARVFATLTGMPE